MSSWAIPSDHWASVVRVCAGRSRNPPRSNHIRGHEREGFWRMSEGAKWPPQSAGRALINPCPPWPATGNTPLAVLPIPRMSVHPGGLPDAPPLLAWQPRRSPLQAPERLRPVLGQEHVLRSMRCVRVCVPGGRPVKCFARVLLFSAAHSCLACELRTKTQKIKNCRAVPAY